LGAKDRRDWNQKQGPGRKGLVGRARGREVPLVVDPCWEGRFGRGQGGSGCHPTHLRGFRGVLDT